MIVIAFFQFIREYIKNPSNVGAVCPSSKRLAKKMVCGIDFKRELFMVEYGPGTGVFTEELVNNMNDKSILILLEYNEEFCAKLNDRFKGKKNVYIYNDSAEKVEFYLKKYNREKADYIVSGLPFTSLDKEISENILNATKRVLGRDGKFITFQYTLLKKKFFEQYFKIDNICFELLNIPSAFVFSFSNK